MQVDFRLGGLWCVSNALMHTVLQALPNSQLASC